MPERHKLTGSELGKLQLYQRLMSYQLSWSLAYYALFVTIELGLLLLAIQLKDVESTATLITICIITFAIGLIVLLYYYASTREMDRWKDKILEVIQGTDLEEDFEHWQGRWYRWNKTTRGGMRLLWMVPLLALLLWAWLQLVF